MSWRSSVALPRTSASARRWAEARTSSSSDVMCRAYGLRGDPGDGEAPTHAGASPTDSRYRAAAALGGCLHEHFHVLARQDRVEHRVRRLVDRVRCEVDRIVRVGLGPLGAELRCLEVLLGLRLVDPLPNVLTVLRPVALNLLPVSFGLVCGRLRLHTQLRSAFVRVLARLGDLGLQLGLALRCSNSDTALALLDLR